MKKLVVAGVMVCSLFSAVTVSAASSQNLRIAEVNPTAVVSNVSTVDRHKANKAVQAQPKYEGRVQVQKSAGIMLPSVVPAGRDDDHSYQPGAFSKVPVPAVNPYAYHTDFGKSNLRKWSSTEGMDTPWSSNYTTDTVHLKSSTKAFLDTLNAKAQRAGVSFVITGGAEDGYHASGRYSHANGYKVDISDDGVYQGSLEYDVLCEALAPYKHQITHEWDRGHYDITIYPENYAD